MDAGRRALAVLLLTLWSVVGLSLPANSPAHGNGANRATPPVAAACRRREGQTTGHDEASKTAPASGDDGGDAAFLPCPLDARSHAPLIATIDRPTTPLVSPSRVGPLAGKPRGPPALV